MKEKTINFGNLLNELKRKQVKIVFVENKGLFLEHEETNLYMMELFYQGSYLDKLIKKGAKVNFFMLDKNVSKNIDKCKKKIWTLKDINDFIKEQN